MSCKIGCAIALLLLSLLNATPAIAQPFTKTIAQSAATESPYWNYKDTTGPDYWANLDPAFTNCKTGKNQSPINLTSAESTGSTESTGFTESAESAESANLHFHYEPVPLNLIYDGRTLEVPYAPGSYIMLNGQQYNLLQFHLHSPSEHTVNNRVWDAELHLVHQSDEGDLAVVAVLLQSSSQASSHSQYFELLSQNLPTPTGNRLRTGQIINAQNLLPRQTTTYRYSGSLTTPPCSEPVTWIVMTEPVTLPTEQLAQYQKLLNHNNRPLQPPNNRTVRIDISH